MLDTMARRRIAVAALGALALVACLPRPATPTPAAPIVAPTRPAGGTFGTPAPGAIASPPPVPTPIPAGSAYPITTPGRPVATVPPGRAYPSPTR